MTDLQNILLVDDEIDFLETTGRRLKRRGYPVKTATDCREALEIIADGWPEVIIMDVMLPGRSGIGCLKEIKRRWPSKVVILLSGHASMQAAIECIFLGADEYCLKPVDLDDLVEKIMMACRMHRGN